MRGLSPGEVCLLDCLHDARNDLRELMERWENRLTLENLSLVEKYVEGGLSMICDLEVGMSRYRLKFSALSDSKPHVGNLDVPIIFGINAVERGYGNNWYKQAVLIHDVKIVQGIQGIIPSLVWLYDINDQINNVQACRLYWSAINGRYQFIPCLSEWELGVFIGNSASRADNLARHEIEGGAQIVNRVSDNERDFLGNGLDRFEFKYIESILIFLDVKSIKVGLEKGTHDRLKFLDVMIGSFDL